MTVGTVLISRTSSLKGSSGRARTLSASSTRPPRQRGAKISNTDRSKQIDVAASRPPSSSIENTSRAQAASAQTLACSTATPLGRPVDPEVYRT